MEEQTTSLMNTKSTDLIVSDLLKVSIRIGAVMALPMLVLGGVAGTKAVVNKFQKKFFN